MTDQIYKVQDPQGNIRQISGPAGASEAEIIEQAQKLFTPAPATPAPPPVAAPKSKYVNLMSMLPPKEESPLSGLYMGATDPFYAGGRLAMETGIGDKQAMDKAIAEREAKYQAGRQNKGFDTNRLAGNILSPPNIALTMALPESLVATVPRLLATGSVLSAGTSLLNPVTEPEQQKDYGNTLQSNMMMAGMMGPVFQGGFKAAGALGSNIAQRVSESSAGEAAKLKLAEVLSKSGVGSLFEPGGAGNALSQIEAKLSKLGPEGTLFDAAGQPTKVLLDTLATLPGQAKTYVEQLIRNRQATRPQRLMTAADESLKTGGAGYQTTLDALVEQRKTAAAPLYEQIRGLSVKVDPELYKLLQASPKSHAKYEELVQLNRGTPIDLSKIKPGDDIPFDALDKVKQALYDLGNDAKGKFNEPTNISASYDKLRRDLISKADKLSPKDSTTNESIYKMARNAFEGPSQLKNAVEAGRTAMKNDQIGVSELMKDMGTSELEAFRIGALQALRDKVGTKAGQTSLLDFWRETKTSGPLKEIFGNDYRKFTAALFKEESLKKIESVGRGSQTAQRLLSTGELDANDVMQAGQAVASAGAGNPAPLLTSVMNIGKKISTPEQTRNEMAKLLLQKGPFAMRTLRELPLAVKQFNEAQARNAALANTLAQQPNR
jgi:hypothetical protein